MTNIFIDGKEGTTGLQIYERLSLRKDIQLITLAENERKDPSKRKEALNSCDIAFLCLPDAAAIEAAAMVENPLVKIIDASTAHRTNDEWAYGFGELSAKHMQMIASSKRIANPGCHASGFIALITPLIAEGVLSTDAQLCATSITGYSGGGKKMIAQYEAADRDPLLAYPRSYALTLQHKHLKEMKMLTGLSSTPAFQPIVADFYSGMCVTVPLFASQLCEGKTVEDIKKVYADKYTGPIVRYNESCAEGGFLSAAALSGKDSMEVAVFGNDERIILTAVYDNLGKGASGAAVQCLNYVLGADICEGLEL